MTAQGPFAGRSPGLFDGDEGVIDVVNARASTGLDPARRRRLARHRYDARQQRERSLDCHNAVVATAGGA